MEYNFKWKEDPSKIIDALRDSLYKATESAKKEIAETLYKEIVRTAPVDTGTYKASWRSPQEFDGRYLIQNRLPPEYMGNGVSHRAVEAITTGYNQFILDGNKAGAPVSYIVTQNHWEYRNIQEAKLQDINLIFWKLNQGAFGINPFTLINRFFTKSILNKV